MPKVVCIHIGARAHYLIPQSLEASGHLSGMITDTWITSSTLRRLLKKVPVRMIQSFSNRYNKGLPNYKVYSFSLYFLVIELYIRYRYKITWEQIIARNKYFERWALSMFTRQPVDQVVLCISYTALQVLRKAKQQQQKTILFQVDPGIIEEMIVLEVVNKYKDKYITTWKQAPPEYWKHWHEECALAEFIIVNSEWSKTALIKAGIAENKIKTIPLPFQLEQKHSRFTRLIPDVYNTSRPLKCLFLGTLTLRKGIHLILEAAESLLNEPVEFIIVGQTEIDETLLNLPNVRYKGLVTRENTDRFYQEADVFLFTTLSDGFGLTQLEAMAWQLPVIASKYCGEVVIDDWNGLQLAECTSASICDALHGIINQPEKIGRLSSKCIETVMKYSMKRFSDNLSSLLQI